MAKIIVGLGVAYAISLAAIAAFALAPTQVDLEVASADAAAISGWVESRLDERVEYVGRLDPVTVRLSVSELNGEFFTSNDQSLILSGTVRKAGVTLARVHATGQEVSIDGGNGRIAVGTGLLSRSVDRQDP